MNNLEKAQVYVDYRENNEDAAFTLNDWEGEARRTRVNIDDYVDAKYKQVLRSIELDNSDDPFSIMTAAELAFAERMCDREPRVYLEGDALKEHEEGMAVARAEVMARKERSRLELLEMDRKINEKNSRVSFEDVFG